VPILHALLTLFGLGLLLTTLPLVLELSVLSLAAAWPPRRVAAGAARAMRLAVVIPAHNEQQLIAASVTSLRASSLPPNVIYVVAHNCTDATAARAAAAGATVLTLEDAVGGKGRALHFGFTHALAAGAEIVLVIDADSKVSPDLVAAVVEAFAAGAQALQCRYIASNAESSPRNQLLALALLGMNVLRPRGRARLGLSCGIFGNGFALRAETLRLVPYVANSVVEDLEYHLHLLRAGIRVDFLDAATVAGEMPESSAAAGSQRARWEGGRQRMRREWAASLLADIVSGRARMIEPLLDVLSLPLASEAGLLCVGLLVPLSWLRLYAGLGLLVLVVYVLVSASLGPEPGKTLRALLVVPEFLLWKLLLSRRKRHAARPDAAWVRTPRNQSERLPAEPGEPASKP
jgi:glycosyltransferase involved in cell wall biosynthesis